MNPEQLGWFSGDQAPCEPITPSAHRPYRLVLLGPPGVGKGTQASLLSKRLRACHLSTGDLFRSAQCEGAASPAIQRALEAMQRGELISDELVIAMVRERSNCLRCRGGFLLDGFPRTVRQAEALEELLVELNVQLDAAVHFDLPVEEIVERLSGRRTCGSCQAVFHIAHHPPKVAGVCDRCQGALVQRKDDQPASIRVRMRVFEEATRPLIDYYEQSDQLQNVRAAGSPEEIYQRTLRLLERNHCAEGSSK